MHSMISIFVIVVSNSLSASLAFIVYIILTLREVYPSEKEVQSALEVRLDAGSWAFS
jgi:hypothetical protein